MKTLLRKPKKTSLQRRAKGMPAGSRSHFTRASAAEKPAAAVLSALNASDVISLQKKLGNQATRQLVLRQVADDSASAPAFPETTGTEFPMFPAVPQPTPEERYNLVIGTQVLQNVTKEEALRQLRRQYNHIDAEMSGEEAGYEYQKENVDDHPVVSWFSDLLGGTEMPSRDLYTQAHNSLNLALDQLNEGSVQGSVQALVEAEKRYIAVHTAFQEYIGATVKGAERSVTTLKVTAGAGAVAATVATGGLAAEAEVGLLGTSSLVGATAGGYGMTQDFAGQASERVQGLRQEFDWTAIFRRGAKDAITGFVGALAGGALSGLLKRSCGAYLSSFTEAELAEMGQAMGLEGPLSREFLLTEGQKYFADFISGVGVAPLTTSIGVVIESLTGGKPPKDMQEFVDLVMHDMIQAGVMSTFVAGFTHVYGASGGRSSAPESNSNAGENPLVGVDTDAFVENAFSEGTLESGPVKPIKTSRSPEKRLDIRGSENETGSGPEITGQVIEPQSAGLAKEVLGKKISDEGHLQELWDRAASETTANKPLTSQNYAELYAAARRKFWKAVREDAEASKFFSEHGFVFDPASKGNNTAPVLADALGKGVPKDEFRISLDHVEPKAKGSNWMKALDASNLEFRMQADNTMI